MKKKLYLVRHGQTLFNKKELMQGWCDSPLTPLGHQQAKATRQYFKDKGIDFDYAACSPLGRCEQTLKDITELPYDRIDGLKEFGYGTLEGESVKKACHNHDLETFYIPYGGESKSQVEVRMDQALREIMEKENAGTVLAVSHGSSSFRFASKVDPAKAKKLRKFANCVIYEFDYEDGKFTLRDIIDEHVRQLKE